MREKTYRDCLQKIRTMTPEQIAGMEDSFNRIRVLNRLFVDHNMCCRHCGSDNFIKNGVQSGMQRYKCKDCGKTFNILSETPVKGFRDKKYLDSRIIREYR